MSVRVFLLSILTIVFSIAGSTSSAFAQSQNQNQIQPDSYTETQAPPIPHSRTVPPVVATSSHQVGKQVLAQPALDGYCPICVVNMKTWEKGNSAFTSIYDGDRFYFPNAAIKTKFDQSPQTSVPALGGDCVVCFANMKKRVPGSIYHTSVYKNRLYLFPGDQQKQIFEANPEAFVNADLAADGNCTVCLAKMNQRVPGSSEFTVIHQGLRYQFPSAKEAAMFRESPNQFIEAMANHN